MAQREHWDDEMYEAAIDAVSQQLAKIANTALDQALCRREAVLRRTLRVLRHERELLTRRELRAPKRR